MGKNVQEIVSSENINTDNQKISKKRSFEKISKIEVEKNKEESSDIAKDAKRRKI